MKIDFSQSIIGPDGEDLGFHLGKVALSALNAPPAKDVVLALDMATRRGNLALLVAGGGEHDISPEDSALIRSLLPNAWSPVVVARAAKLLEG